MLPFCGAAVEMNDHCYGCVHRSGVFLGRRRAPVAVRLHTCVKAWRSDYYLTALLMKARVDLVALAEGRMCEG